MKSFLQQRAAGFDVECFIYRVVCRLHCSLSNCQLMEDRRREADEGFKGMSRGG